MRNVMRGGLRGFNGGFTGRFYGVVGKVARKVVDRGCGIVGKVFGFLKNRVRFSAKWCSVEKFSWLISTFGFVRFTPVFGSDLDGFPHFPHSLLLLLNN